MINKKKNDQRNILSKKREKLNLDNQSASQILPNKLSFLLFLGPGDCNVMKKGVSRKI